MLVREGSGERALEGEKPEYGRGESSIEVLAQGIQGDRAREKAKELDKYVNWWGVLFPIYPIVYLVFL